MRRLVLLLFVLTFTSGCAWLGFGDDEGEGGVVVDKPLIDVRFVDSGRINNLQRLKEGGRLLIKPFSAGPNIEVNKELDKVSLRIVRGILDVYEHQWPQNASHETLNTQAFDMALMEEEEEADLKVHGRITEISSSSKWKKYVLLKPKRRLSVEGWLVDVKNKQTILSFKDTVEAKADKRTHRDLGLETGRNIGEFIFSKRK